MPTQDITAAEVGDRFGATMTQPVQRGERLANGVFGRVGRELACESDDPDPRVVKQRGERPVGLIRRDTSAPNAEVDIDMDVQAAARHITCHEAGHLDLADQPLDVDVGTRKVKAVRVQDDEAHVEPGSPYQGGLHDRSDRHDTDAGRREHRGARHEAQAVPVALDDGDHLRTVRPPEHVGVVS